MSVLKNGFKYTVHEVSFKDPLTGMPEGVAYWAVKDFQGAVVARCDKKYDAELICRLLNRNT